MYSKTALTTGSVELFAGVLYASPSPRAHRLGGRLENLAVNPVLPVVFVVVVAVAAFVALAVIIGAIAAYIYYCQTHGGRWPGLQVPGKNGGVFKLGCFR